jgi:hypothetical protein
MIGVCESMAALDRVRTLQSTLLTALKREQPTFYARIGKAFGARGRPPATPAKPPTTSKPAKPAKRTARVTPTETADAEPASA